MRLTHLHFLFSPCLFLNPVPLHFWHFGSGATEFPCWGGNPCWVGITGGFTCLEGGITVCGGYPCWGGNPCWGGYPCCGGYPCWGVLTDCGGKPPCGG